MSQAFIKVSSCTASAQNARIPSASFSVAMASWFKANLKSASFKDGQGMSKLELACASKAFDKGSLQAAN